MSNWKPSWPSDRKPRIGFIGLGIMGKPMARNLMGAGYSLTVYNRTRSKADDLVREGAALADTPKAVAEESDVVISIVGDSPDVVEVILGEHGAAHGARRGQAFIDMTTMSPEVAREIHGKLAASGVAFLDAPVSGGDKGAIAGTLSIMVGGEPEAFEACRPVLGGMGTNIVHVGPPGMGQTVKLCNQVICGLNLLAVAEGLAFAAKSGADLNKVLSVVTKGAAGSWILENLGPKIVAGDYAPGFMVKLQQKDLRLALTSAGERDLPLPGTALVQQLFRSVQAQGFGDEGTQALVKAYAALGRTSVGGETSGA